MKNIYLLFGGNLGNVRNNIESAVLLVTQQLGSILQQSSFYLSEPWGFRHEMQFINKVIVCKTDIEPLAVLNIIKLIEQQYGRKRTGNQYEARTMDIDILFIDDEIIRMPELEVPHPRLHLRKFTLQPLFEINPDLIHPVYKLTISEMLTNCKDQLMVKKIN